MNTGLLLLILTIANLNNIKHHSKSYHDFEELEYSIILNIEECKVHYYDQEKGHNFLRSFDIQSPNKEKICILSTDNNKQIEHKINYYQIRLNK